MLCKVIFTCFLTVVSGSITNTGTGPGGGNVSEILAAVSGSSDRCLYKGKYYRTNETWEDGCDYTCECNDGKTGFYKCVGRCPTYYLPAGCVLMKPAERCCGIPVCNRVSVTGPTDDRCLYKGKYYRTNETWEDGCDYTCECKDGKTGFYKCVSRCLTYYLPAGCVLMKPAGQCCGIPVCTRVSVTGSGGRTQGCLYNNKFYQQGQAWRDGCKYNCKCVNAKIGQYSCSPLCVDWQIPRACNLIPPAAGKCCQTPNCPPRYILTYPPGYDKNNPP